MSCGVSIPITEIINEILKSHTDELCEGLSDCIDDKVDSRIVDLDNYVVDFFIDDTNDTLVVKMKNGTIHSVTKDDLVNFIDIQAGGISGGTVNVDGDTLTIVNNDGTTVDIDVSKLGRKLKAGRGITITEANNESTISALAEFVDYTDIGSDLNIGVDTLTTPMQPEINFISYGTSTLNTPSTNISDWVDMNSASGMVASFTSENEGLQIASDTDELGEKPRVAVRTNVGRRKSTWTNWVEVITTNNISKYVTNTNSPYVVSGDINIRNSKTYIDFVRNDNTTIPVDITDVVGDITTNVYNQVMSTGYRINTQAGDYTLQASDFDGRTLVRMDKDGTSTVTITKPPAEDFIGKTVLIRKTNGDTNTILNLATDTGVSISPTDSTPLRRPGSSVTLVYIGNGAWDVFGELP